MNSIDNAPRRPVVPVEKLFPAWACCCFLGSCYWSYPQCLGCYAQQVVGCCQSEQILCKTNDEHGVCCTTTKIECVCRRESTCFRCIFQLLCMDVRCGIPHSSQHPCICTICFATVNTERKWMAKCCATVNEALGLDTAALAEPLRTDAPLPSAPAMLSIDRPPGSRTFSTGAVRLSTAGTGGNNEDVPLAMVVHFDDSQILSAAYSVNTSARNSVNFYAHHASGRSSEQISSQQSALLASPLHGLIYPESSANATVASP